MVPYVVSVLNTLAGGEADTHKSAENQSQRTINFEKSVPHWTERRCYRLGIYMNASLFRSLQQTTARQVFTAIHSIHVVFQLRRFPTMSHNRRNPTNKFMSDALAFSYLRRFFVWRWLSWKLMQKAARTRIEPRKLIPCVANQIQPYIVCSRLRAISKFDNESASAFELLLHFSPAYSEWTKKYGICRRSRGKKIKKRTNRTNAPKWIPI